MFALFALFALFVSFVSFVSFAAVAAVMGSPGSTSLSLSHRACGGESASIDFDNSSVSFSTFG
ncbi:hypothetical protein BMMON2_02110 [Burkholderia mallei]|nr:hypothetical protein DM52_3943 [Burkholderia mallei]